MNGNTIKVAELFAGIGGFRLGLENANQTSRLWHTPTGQTLSSRRDSTMSFCRSCGPRDKTAFEIVWANEWDKHAATIYRKNFGKKELVEADVKTVNPQDIPDIDVLCGGFPCQPFSMAGKREGFQDIRGTLFFEIMRIAKAKRPKILFLENVKGLLNHDKGDTFETIIRTMGNAGYWYEYKVLNSKFSGVPQNRERVFIIGHLREGCTRQVFPITSNGAENPEVGEVAGTLTGGGHNGGLHSNMTAIISNTVRSGGRGSLDRHSWDIVNNVRRLTPTECERLQGFPDGWTTGISDTQRYKCLGNAVTVNVIQEVSELLLGAFD